jgi:hypothetical protein
VDDRNRARPRAARADSAARDGKHDAYGAYAFRDRRIRRCANEYRRTCECECGCTHECGCAYECGCTYECGYTYECKRDSRACTACACRACA